VEFDAAIFDLDGTLADTLEDIADAMNRVLGRRALPAHGLAAYRLMIGKGLRNLVGETLPREMRSAGTIAACLDEMLLEYRDHCLDKTHLYGGIAELTSRLRVAGVGLAVLSNKADELTQRIVGALFEAGRFDVVLGARPGLPLKPDPAAALLVAERLGVPPARLAYLGDSGIDMRTATAAGMIAVGVSWGFRARDELVESGARVVLDRPLELLELRGSSRRARLPENQTDQACGGPEEPGVPGPDEPGELGTGRTRRARRPGAAGRETPA
jgi:phosphoglycolate phosphatase